VLKSEQSGSIEPAPNGTTGVTSTVAVLTTAPHREPGPSATKNKALQLWEGKVEAVNAASHEFTAIIRDQTRRDYPDEQVVLGFEELGEEDRPLVRPGAVFYWSIRYQQEVGMPRETVSRIRFRRLPNWGMRDRGRAEAFAKSARRFWINDSP
jgi:hypothetical protein